MTDPMNGVLYWPAAGSGRADPAGRPDLAMMMRVAAESAAPLPVALADSVDRLALEGRDFLVISDAHLDDSMVDRLRAAPTIRWVQLSSSGAERAVAAGLPARVALTNAAPVWAPAVADHAVALLLALVRQIPELTRLQAASTWSPTTAGRRARSLSGMTAVILGSGAVGSEIGSRIGAFGVRTVGVNRRGTPGAGTAAFTSYAPVSELSEVLAGADILFVSVPLRPETRHLIGARELALLGPDGYLINVARGAVIAPGALEDAMARHALAGAALDVTEPEPLPAESPLWGADQVIVSPHMASMPVSASTGRELGALIRENGERLRDGRDLLGRVS
jgi:phosphoglycerate dehydrogenase-like enzyme